MNLIRLHFFVPAIILAAAPVLRADEGKGSSPMGFLADVMIEYLDTNSDRVIDLGEFQAGYDRGFGEMDSDGDGFLSDKELGGLGGMLAESKDAGGIVATAAGVLLASCLKTMDADRDGRISRDEFRKGSEGYFIKLDANGDKRVTRDELLAMPSRILGK